MRKLQIFYICSSICKIRYRYRYSNLDFVLTVHSSWPGGPQHPPVREQRGEDLWLWFSTGHLQRPWLRAQRQCKRNPLNKSMIQKVLYCSIVVWISLKLQRQSPGHISLKNKKGHFIWCKFLLSFQYCNPESKKSNLK